MTDAQDAKESKSKSVYALSKKLVQFGLGASLCAAGALADITAGTFLDLIPDSNAAVKRSIHVEWGYTPPSEPAVDGYRLYQEGVEVASVKASDGITDVANQTSMDAEVTLTAATTNFTLTAHFADGTESPHSAPFAFSTAEDTTVTTASNGAVMVTTANALTSAVAGVFSTAALTSPLYGTWMAQSADNIHATSGSTGTNNYGAYVPVISTTGAFCVWTFNEAGTLTGITPAVTMSYNGQAYKAVYALLNEDQTQYKVLGRVETIYGHAGLVRDISPTSGAVTTSSPPFGPYNNLPNYWSILDDGLGYNALQDTYYLKWRKGAVINLALKMKIDSTNSFSAMYVYNPPETNSYLMNMNTNGVENELTAWSNIDAATGYETGRVCLATYSPTGVLKTGSTKCYGPFLPWLKNGFSPENTSNSKLFFTYPVVAGNPYSGAGLWWLLNSSNDLVSMQTINPTTGFKYTKADGLRLKQVATNGSGDEITVDYAPHNGTAFLPRSGQSATRYTAATGTFTKFAP